MLNYNTDTVERRLPELIWTGDDSDNRKFGYNWTWTGNKENVYQNSVIKVVT
jgi:hypothetical protein